MIFVTVQEKAMHLPARHTSTSFGYPHRDPARFADEMLKQNYDCLKGTVLRIVRGNFRKDIIDGLDLEVCYQDAWLTLYEELMMQEIKNVTGFLVTVAYRRAIDALRRSRPTQQSQVAVERLWREYDIDHELDCKQRISSFKEALQQLPPGETYEAAVLCLFYRYPRREAANQMNISERKIHKLLDGVYPTLRPALEMIEKDEWCETYTSSLRAFRRDLLDTNGKRHRELVRHLKRCETCSAIVRGPGPDDTQ
jgi:RNA polymerase sigma factor (sigma-70 family)